MRALRSAMFGSSLIGVPFRRTPFYQRRSVRLKP